MKVEGQAPTWAIELIEQVCKDYNRGKPGLLQWKSRSGFHSSGSTHYGKMNGGGQIYDTVRLKNGKIKRRPDRGYIIVREGSSELDARLVLLHELAHWTAYRTKAKGHTVVFWKRAFELYSKYGEIFDVHEAYQREKHYKKFATQIYEKFYKPKHEVGPITEMLYGSDIPIKLVIDPAKK